MSEQNATQNNTQNLSEILQVRRDKLKALQDAGKDPFQVNTSDRDILASEILERFEELENKDVCIAGRIMSKRGKGRKCYSCFRLIRVVCVR